MHPYENKLTKAVADLAFQLLVRRWALLNQDW